MVSYNWRRRRVFVKLQLDGRVGTVAIGHLYRRIYIGLHSDGRFVGSLMCYPGAPKCEIAPDCIAAWDDLKNQKYRYILLTFSNDLEWIVVERRAPRESTYDEFLEELPPMDVRYALYDHEYLGSDGEHRNKLIFLVWAPDIAPVKRKLMMASTKFMLKNAVPGVCWETAGPDESDMPPTRLGG